MVQLACSDQPLESGERAFASPDPRDPPNPAEQPTAGYLDQDALKFFYKWGGQLSATLVRIRGRFDGDLDQYLIYLVFLLTQLSQVVASQEAEARGGRALPPRDRGLNALSVADITHIPRETARRKLQALTTAGYLRRGEGGLYFLAGRYGIDAFFFDLSPLFWEGVKVSNPR